MFHVGQIVRCVASDAMGLTRGKYYTITSLQDGWVTMVNDSGTDCCFAPGRFRSVDQETLAEEGYLEGIARQRPTTEGQGSVIAGALAGYRGTRQVILLVDDNARLRRSTAEHLRYLNYAVVEAAGASEAMIRLEADPTLELLFTDIVMPGGMNGFELARAAVALRPDLKVLLTTGFPLARHGRDPTQNLGWPMIGKPYRLRELGSHLANLLPNPETPRESGPYLVASSG